MTGRTKPWTVAAAATSAFLVGLIGGATTLWILVAEGTTNAFQNLLIAAAVTFASTFGAALATSRRPALAAGLAAVLTAIVVGGGFAIIYLIYSNLCGAHPSSC